MPTWREVKPWIIRGVLLILALWLVYQVRTILVPLAIAFLIALVLDPVVDRLERRGWSRTAGSALIFGGFLFMVAGILVLTGPPLMREAAAVERRLDKVFPDRSPAGFERVLDREGITGGARALLVRAYGGAVNGFARTTRWLSENAMDLASNLVWMIIIPIISFYMLRDFHLMLAKALLLVRRGRRELVQTAVADVTAIFARYMRGLAVVSVLNGVTTWLVLLALRVPGALMIGVIAGVIYSVPYIGAMVTVAVIAGISFLAGGFELMLLATGANLILHQILFDQIITPRILGGHVGLHPILSIIALLVGNLLLGLVGMVLAVPIAACIQIGVLALVPKLREEIELPTPGDGEPTAGHLAEATKDRQIEVDATEELHKSVTEAVDVIEKQVRAGESPPGGRGG